MKKKFTIVIPKEKRTVSKRAPVQPTKKETPKTIYRRNPKHKKLKRLK